MNKVYIVTSGEYSDYGIDGVFSSKEKARKYIEFCEKVGIKRENDVYGIEEYEIDHEDSLDYKKYENRIPFYVIMERDGKVNYINGERWVDWGNIYVIPQFNIHGNMYINVMAKDEKHAIKIANEKRVELIVMNKWKGKTKQQKRPK